MGVKEGAMARFTPLPLLLFVVTLTGCAGYQRIEHDGQTRRYVLHVPDGVEVGVP